MAKSWDDVITSHVGNPPRILIHGQPKVGKTSFAVGAPRPVIVATENGLGRTEELANVPAFFNDEWSDVLETLDTLIGNADRYDTVVIDSLDHAEVMLHRVLCQRGNVESIEQYDKGFGKGYIAAAIEFRNEYDARIVYLQRELDKNIIEICHSAAVKENPPDMLQGFTRWAPKLNKHIADHLKEQADIIGYAHIPIITAEMSGGFGQKTTKATAVGERRLALQPAGAYLAGCRYPAPEWINLSWPELAQYITYVAGEESQKAA